MNELPRPSRTSASRSVVHGLLTIAVAATFACEPAAPPRPPSPPSKPVASSAIDLSPVAEPTGIGLIFRARNPGHLVTTGFGWLGLTIPPEQLIPSFGKKPMPFDMGASLDAVVLVDPRAEGPTHLAFSLPIRSVAEMKEALGDAVTWRPLDNGAFQMVFPEGTAAGGAREALAGSECALAPSAGDAKARFICAEDRSLAALLPFLTRTLPRTAFDHDVAFDARRNLIAHLAETPMPFVPSSLGAAIPGGTLLLSFIDGATKEARSFASSVDGMNGWLDVDGKGVRLELHMRAHETDSLLSRMFLAPASGPPDAFFRLPVDADFALFGAGTPKAVLDDLRARANPSISRALADLAPTSPASAIVDSAFGVGRAPWVAAVSMGAQKDDAGSTAKKPWIVASVEEPFADVEKLARAFVGKPSGHVDPRSPTIREAKMPRGFSKDALAIDISLPVELPASVNTHTSKAPALDIHVLLAASGSSTWLVVSPDVPTATDLLTRAVTKSASSTLSERPESAWFKGRSLVGGADMGLRATIDDALLASVLGDLSKNIRLPPPAPFLFSTEVSRGATKPSVDDLTIRMDVPASISVGLFFGAFQDMFKAHSAPE